MDSPQNPGKSSHSLGHSGALSGSGEGSTEGTGASRQDTFASALNCKVHPELLQPHGIRVCPWDQPQLTWMSLCGTGR